MIPTLLFIIGSLGLGNLVTTSLPLAFYREERYAYTAVLGLFLSSWILLACCWWFEFLAGSYVAITLLLVASILGLYTRRVPDTVTFTPRQSYLWLGVTGIFTLIISYLLSTHMLAPGTDGVYSGGGTWGDLPLHLSIINRFAQEPSFNWDFSLMAGAKLTYPFLIDFVSGIFLRWGVTLRQSLLFISFPLCICLIQLLFFTALRLSKSVRAAAIFTALFLLSGSSFGFIKAMYDVLTQHQPLTFWLNPPVDYSNTSFFGFGNVITSILLPQRSFEFGLTIFCIILGLLQYITSIPKQPRIKAARVLVGILVGLLPLAHTHTFFIALAICGISVLFERGMRHPHISRDWIPAIIVCLLLAVPQLMFQLTANGRSHFIHFHVGWMFSAEAVPHIPSILAFIGYILANFGLIFLFTVLGRKYWGHTRIIAGLTICGILLFIGGNLFTFQPASYDNIKFFVYTYLFCCLPVSLYLSTLTRSTIWKRIGATLSLVLLAASGSLGLLWAAHQHVLLYPTQAFTQASTFRRILPANAIVLTSDYHQHPLWGLAGQPVVRGYSYWLWSYGLQQGMDVNPDIPTMYAGGDTAIKLLARYGVQYVYIGESERRMYTINQDFYHNSFPVVYTDGTTTIYAVKPT